MIWGSSTEFGQERDIISGQNFLDLRDRSTTIRSMTAFRGGGGAIIIEGRPVPTSGLRVAPNFFSFLGSDVALGRSFVAEDGRAGRGDVAVISYDLWQQLGADSAVVGRVVEMTSGSFEVVGVLPVDFGFVGTADLITPLDMDRLRREGRMSIDYWALGRLAAGVTVQQAGAELNAILDDIAVEDSRIRVWDVVVEPLQGSLFQYVRPPLLLLQGAVGLMLLIGCANVANIFLARGLGRNREMAIRASLGASRRRLVGQLLTESLLLSVVAGVVGVLLTVGAVRALPNVMPPRVPVPGSSAMVQIPEIHVSGIVLLFALSVSVVVAVVFGLAPAMQVARHDVTRSLKEGALSTTESKRARALQNLIIGTELAMAVALLAATGVTLTSVVSLVGSDPGLNPHNVLTMYVGELDDLSDSTRARYYREILRVTENLPGVVAAGLTDYVPFQQEDDFEGFDVVGRPRTSEASWRVEWRRVSAGYAAAAGLPLLDGRWFTEADFADAPSVAVVNQAMAARYWPGENPVGQRINIHERVYETAEIVGVVGDVRRRGLDQPAPPLMYVPFPRKPRPTMALFIRTAGIPQSLIEPVKLAIWSVDSRQPVHDIDLLSRIISRSVTVPRLVLILTGVVAVLALVLSGIGVYSLMSYAVNQRTREMSIRMAFGAGRGDVLRHVIGSAFRLALAAVAVGLVSAWLIVRAASALLFGMASGYATTFAVAGMLVLVVALGATYLPAKRATLVDPASSLRAE